jgi:hypothetical protein
MRMRDCCAVRKNRDGFCCALDINGKRITQQVLCFTDIVGKISNQAHCLDERETKDEINGNIRACCNKEGGVVTILGSVRKMNVEPNIGFGGDRCGVWCVHNTGEDDSHIIVRKIELPKGVRVLADHRLHEVKVSGAKCGSGIEDTLECWTVLFLVGQAHLEYDMHHRGLLIAIGMGGFVISEERITTTS